MITIIAFSARPPRAGALVSRLEEEPHVNPSTGTMELSLRDLDGDSLPSVRLMRRSSIPISRFERRLDLRRQIGIKRYLQLG
jgi:hypothetical protein